jgi:hypothetical protein
VNTLRVAERRLDDFWSLVDTVITESSLQQGHTDRDLALDVFSLLRRGQTTVQRTPEYVEPDAPASDKESDAKLEPAATVHLPFSGLSLDDAGTTPESAWNAPTPRGKVKTRGVPGNFPDPPPQPPSPESDDEPLRIAVDTRSLKLFRTLFFDPTVNTTPGEVS